jgi:aryl-alcohol dehydrogenase-like predicted oxidoreductase
MEYRRLGTSAIDVSMVCLGTMTWGEQNTEAEAHAQLDRALDLGINFLDAAEIYPVPPRAETFGRTEAIIGSWLAARPGARAKVVIASKVAGANNTLAHIRNGATLSRKQINEAIDGSLKRLRTDRIDLYQTHTPDRGVAIFGRPSPLPDAATDGTPIEETLDALGELVKAGKVREIGVSNETAYGVMRHLRHAEKSGAPRVQSIQNVYSLLNRRYEEALAEVAMRADVKLLPYSPLGMGVLSGKYLGGAWPAGARITMFRDRYKRYLGARSIAATEAYAKLARRHGLDPAQMALAFVMSRPFVLSTIIGCTSVKQLEQDAAAAALKLSPELLAEIDAIHADSPNPAP